MQNIKLEIVPNLDINKTILSCRNNINGRKWLKSCSSVCEKFSLTQFDEFFHPRLADYQKYLSDLKPLLDTIFENENLLLKEKKQIQIIQPASSFVA